MENRKNFLERIRSNRQEDTELLKLQHRFENDEISLSMMSDEEIHNINLLYTRQINDLKKERENKKTELNITKYRMISLIEKCKRYNKNRFSGEL